jgi:hypothetical protein
VVSEAPSRASDLRLSLLCFVNDIAPVGLLVKFSSLSVPVHLPMPSQLQLRSSHEGDVSLHRVCHGLFAQVDTFAKPWIAMHTNPDHRLIAETEEHTAVR